MITPSIFPADDVHVAELGPDPIVLTVFHHVPLHKLLAQLYPGPIATRLLIAYSGRTTQDIAAAIGMSRWRLSRAANGVTRLDWAEHEQLVQGCLR